MRDVVVQLAGVAGMFEAPPGDPEAPGFAFASGLERVLAAAGTLTAAERRAARLVVRVPAPGDAARIAAALARYAAVRRGDIGLRLAALRREGLQTLALAGGFILVCVVVWGAIELLLGEGLLKALARDGVVIAAWVALWRPLDLLLFDTWLLGRERRILAAVAAMPVVVEAAG